jgi:membrane protease subunit HflK
MISLNEVGVLQRFGRMINSHVMPGIHYAFPWPIDKIDKIPVKKVHRIIFDDFSENSRVAKIFRDLTGLDSYCITGDNNIVTLICVLQFTIVQPADYLFNIRDNEQALKNMVSSTIIHTLSIMSVDEILTYGKHTIENNIKLDLQKRLDDLKTGLSIIFVELREVHPPQAVQSYFDDVINSKIDKKKIITTAESYKNEKILKANAQANRLMQQAEAYRQKAIAEAIGETKRFLEQLKEAKNDLTLTKRQIYMQFVKEFWPKLESKYVVEPGAAEYLRLKTY